MNVTLLEGPVIISKRYKEKNAQHPAAFEPMTSQSGDCEAFALLLCCLCQEKTIVRFELQF